MNYVELFINNPTNAQLDMDQAFDIALQYSIADIKDISKRNSAYSKTITLPGTKNNNFWLGNLFDINADFTAFNPNKKTSAKILVNSETVIDGFLQLKKIKKLVNVDHQGNNIQYEVVVFNNAVDLMTELGEKLLSQINLTQYQHTYSKQNIIDSWSHSYVDGYVYPMYGDDNKDFNYKVENFYPAIFYRTLLDGIFRDAGYGWTGSLATNAQFNKEIIPYVGEASPKLGETEKTRRLFKAGRTQSFTGATISWPTGVSSVYFANSETTVPLNDDSTLPNFDNDNHWDTTLYEWTCDRNGKYNFTYNVRCDFTVRNTFPDPAIAFYSQVPKTAHEFYLQTFINGSWIEMPDSKISIEKSYPLSIGIGNQVVQTINGNKTSNDVDLYVGAKVRLRSRVKKVSMWYWADTASNVGQQVAAFALPCFITFYPGDTWLQNKVTSTNISQDDEITWDSILSEKMKQKDILNDLIKRYNVFIQVDPSNDRLLILDTRDDFYARGTVLDWTKKKDYSSEDNIELLSELQFKTMLLSYKPDTDNDNKDYTLQTSDIWGQYKHTFDNDFVKGENKIESPFSPTPIVKTLFGAFVPSINADIPKVQPRVLIWGGMKQYGSTWRFNSNITISGQTFLAPEFMTNGYPYAGHLDDPINPTVDNNFGTIKYPFYSELENITNNNMFNNYWANYVSQIEEGRLVTSKFYLNETDVRFIKDNFNTKIFVLDSYYYINKIKDYKLLKNGVTEVELLKIPEGVRWKQGKISSLPYKPIKDIYTYGQISPGNQNANGGAVSGGGVVIGSGNTTGGTIVATNSTVKPAKTFVLGDRNFSLTDKSMLIGDGNTLGGDKSFVLGGDDNIVENDKSFVMSGDENSVRSGFVIEGSNNILTGDGAMVIGGSNNTLSGNNAMSIGAFGLSSSESDTIFLGPSFSVSTIDGTIKVNGATFSGGTGSSGVSGTSGTSGADGTSGTSFPGITSGTSGTSGVNGSTGSAGSSGTSGTRGTSGTSGVNGTSGTSGYNGPAVSGFQWKSTNFTGGDPGGNNFSLDNTNTQLSTTIYINERDTSGNDLSVWISSIASLYATNTVLLQISTPDNSVNTIYELNDYEALSGGLYFRLGLIFISGSGVISLGNTYYISMLLNGGPGPSGTSGTSGSSGSSGVNGLSVVTGGIHGLALNEFYPITQQLYPEGKSSGGANTNIVRLSPFIPAKTFTTAHIQVNVTTAMTGGGGRVGVYTTQQGLPRSLVYSWPQYSSNTTGLKTMTGSFTFVAGTTYYIATIIVAGTIGGPQTVTLLPKTSTYAIGVSTAVTDAINGFTRAHTPGDYNFISDLWAPGGNTDNLTPVSTGMTEVRFLPLPSA